MPVLKHDIFFRQHPVFTGDELAVHLASIGSNGVRTQEKLLGYHAKAGRLRRVRQGMYAVIPPGVDGDTYPVDPYLLAARLTPDAVLSHHTALEFHGRGVLGLAALHLFPRSVPWRRSSSVISSFGAPGSRGRWCVRERSITAC